MNRSSSAVSAEASNDVSAPTTTTSTSSSTPTIAIAVSSSCRRTPENPTMFIAATPAITTPAVISSSAPSPNDDEIGVR